MIRFLKRIWWSFTKACTNCGDGRLPGRTVCQGCAMSQVRLGLFIGKGSRVKS